jgi:hypothetical protein
LPAIGVALASLLVLTIVAPALGRPGAAPRSTRTATWDGAARRAKPAPAVVHARDALTRALERGTIDEATYALERARSLFAPAAVRSRYGAVRATDPRGATMILRDLVARLGDLSPSQLRVAQAILARPTDGAADAFGDGYTVAEATPVCSTNGCIHYVATTADAPAATDTDMDGIPDYVESTRDTFEEVWASEVTAYGYRPPKSDETSTNNGGSGLVDVYVAQLGDAGVYGYCTTDDPNAQPGSGYQYWDFSAYCVVDNDYVEFPPPSDGLAGLQVTLAHEFFHAIQFAYDALEDTWFMESTATWMEDEVYDDVNDNWQYFSDSPLQTPDVPLDYNRGFNVYGAWIFPRYVAESSPTTPGADLIREVWELADASAVGPDQYSTKAYANAIKQAAPGVKFRWVFADFAMQNDYPSAFYEEGADYPFAPPDRVVKVTGRNLGAQGAERLDHLTSRYIWFKPGSGVRPNAKLLVRMDGPAYSTGPEASVVVFYESGKVKFIPMPVSRQGVAEVTVPFGKGKIAEVDLVMTNASTRLENGDCWVDPKWRYSCAGFPRDDNMLYEYWGMLLQ